MTNSRSNTPSSMAEQIRLANLRLKTKNIVSPYSNEALFRKLREQAASKTQEGNTDETRS